MWRKIRPYLNRRNLINLVALLVIGYMGFATLQVISRNYKLQQEVDFLTEEIARQDLRNQELEYQIAYYRTESYAEKEARDKLGLQAPGEKVVIIPSKIPTGVQTAPPQSGAQRALNNLEQWLFFLFKREPTTS